MKDHELERLFERFRRAGDVAALGAIFDATASELLRVAMSLVPDASEADDLLQETFLTAIERAERYDAGRRLVPWLLGLLVHHAKERRRLRGRVPDATRLAAPSVSPPETPALARELDEALERALDDLGARDRALLEAHLRQGKGAAELAAELGAAPGAVRMRIHRGLERLRKAIPAGLALGGASGSLGALGAQGLTAVRETVLRAGGVKAGELALGAGSAAGVATATTAGTAGVLVGKKLMLAAAVAVVAGGLALLRTTGARGDEGVEVAREAPALTVERDALDPAPGALADAVPAAADAPAASARVAAPATDATASDQTRLTGRVVEADGAPVAGVEVALLEVDEDRLYAPADAPPPALLVMTAHTASDGTFTLDGAVSRAIHALGVDLGGERGTLRMLDASLAPGGTSALGDVVLAAHGAVTGRVVDAAGAPVSGARVRAGELPAPFGPALAQLVPGAAFTELRKDGRPDFLLALPEWVAPLESRLPLATTRTGADGRFTLARAPAGLLTVLVDAPEHAPLSTETFTLGSGGSEDLGELVLGRGASVRVRVVDASGAPVGDAEVRAGTTIVGRTALLGPPLFTDAEGHCVAERLQEDRFAVVLARRDARSGWLPGRERDGVFLVELSAELEHALVISAASGEPVSAPEIRLRLGAIGVGVFDPPFTELAVRAVPDAPGRFVAALAPGNYELAVRAPGLAEARSRLTVGADAPGETRVTLFPERVLAVRVTDAASSVPVAGASVRLERVSGDMTALARGMTDVAGHASLVASAGAEPACLVVEHPRFARQTRVLEPGGTPDGVDVALTAGARLVVRASETSERPRLFQLTRTGNGPGATVRIPRLHGLPREGELVLERLEPGPWTWNLFEWGSREALVLLDPDNAPRHLEQGHVELADGVTTEIFLEAEAPPAAAAVGSAGIVGDVRVGGQPARGLEVNLVPLGQSDGRAFQSGDTVSQSFTGGSFHFEELEPGEWLLVVVEEDGTRLLQERVVLAEGEVLELERDIALHALSVRVLGPSGEPVEGARVSVSTGNGPRSPGAADTIRGVLATGRTDPDGTARLAVAAEGPWRVTAMHPDHGVVQTELDGDDAFELTLAAGVECAGRLRFALDPACPENSPRMLLVRSLTDLGLELSCDLSSVSDGAPFQLRGAIPGRYHAYLWCGERMFQTTFELPEGGAGALALLLEPAE